MNLIKDVVLAAGTFVWVLIPNIILVALMYTILK